MEEFSLIKAIKQPHYMNASLMKGIGDDAAVFRQSSQDIVSAVDTFVEGIHFSKETMTSTHIGYRILAANISDMAAMGATPAFYMVSIVVPETWNEEEVLNIFAGMKTLARTYRMDLIGGDTVSGHELMISLTIIGYVEEGKARYRHLSQPNDIVFVTGTLGDAQAGLHILMHDGDYKDKAYYIKQHRQPIPRIDFARSLLPLDRVALNDVSDGIANEAAEIAESSHVNIMLDAEKVPVSDTFNQFSHASQEQWKYFGGEDFELLGTVSVENWAKVQQYAHHTNTKVTQIGYVTHDERSYGNVYLRTGHEIAQLKKHGYTHLK